MSSPYTHDDIQNALDSYGADFTRWPDPDMAAYAQKDDNIKAAFQNAIQSAASLDMALSSHATPMPSDLLKTRILKQASQTAQTTATPASNINSSPSRPQNSPTQPSRISGWMRIAAILLVSVVVGGSFWLSHTPSPTEPAPLMVASLDAETDAWRSAANDMDMMDVFLWVETDG